MLRARSHIPAFARRKRQRPLPSPGPLRNPVFSSLTPSQARKAHSVVGNPAGTNVKIVSNHSHEQCFFGYISALCPTFVFFLLLWEFSSVCKGLCAARGVYSLRTGRNPGLSAGAVPSLARTTGMAPEYAVPGITRDESSLARGKGVSRHSSGRSRLPRKGCN
jgi:hypothetical protein